MATELQDLINILHLIFHRNRNQHRQQLWWRDLSSFRRQLQQHLTDTEVLDGNARNPGVRGGKSTVKKRCDERLGFWAAELVPRWYRSFSQLVASTQFAAIGLVLMAILARVSHLVGITRRYEDQADKEMQRVLQTFAEQDAHTLFEERHLHGGASSSKNEDMGEVVARDEPEQAPPPAPKSVPAPASESTSTPSSPPAPAKKKSKKRKKNPIDDLFAGL